MIWFVYFLENNLQFECSQSFSSSQRCHGIIFPLGGCIVLIPSLYTSIHPADDPSAPALVDLGKDMGTSCNWTVNLPVGM